MRCAKCGGEVEWRDRHLFHVQYSARRQHAPEVTVGSLTAL